MPTITLKDLARKLDAFMEGKTQLQAARKLRITEAYLASILNGRRRIDCPPILRKFGYKKVVEIRSK